MSFLKRLFGGGTAEEDRKEADTLFADKRWYEARVAYERALGRKELSADIKEHASARVDACLDAIAEERIAEAERFIASRQLELAETELKNAMEVAKSDAIKKRARRISETMERKDAARQAQVVEYEDDDERFALLASFWEDTQAEEYDSYGEAFRTAILELADEPKTALPVLEKLAEGHPKAVFLWLEIARGRNVIGDDDGTKQALKLFLERVDDEDRSAARVNAHVALAQLAEKEGNEERAIKILNKGVDAMPDDPRPFMQLGVYLRQKGHAAEAVEVLEAAIGLMDEDRPAWEAYQELGLAKADAGRAEEAVELLEKVVRFFVQRADTNLPPTTAAPLAKLVEEQGNLQRAADLWSTLARGKDRANHLTYHREASRVLEKLGLKQEARRMLTRASALAEGSPEIAAEIEKKLNELEGD